MYVYVSIGTYICKHLAYICIVFVWTELSVLCSHLSINTDLSNLFLIKVSENVMSQDTVSIVKIKIER